MYGRGFFSQTTWDSLSGFNLEYTNNDKHQLPQRDDKNSDTAPYYGYYEGVMSIYINIKDCS